MNINCRPATDLLDIPRGVFKPKGSKVDMMLVVKIAYDIISGR
jgi:hypothetical protein